MMTIKDLFNGHSTPMDTPADDADRSRRRYMNVGDDEVNHIRTYPQRPELFRAADATQEFTYSIDVVGHGFGWLRVYSDGKLLMLCAFYSWYKLAWMLGLIRPYRMQPCTSTDAQLAHLMAERRYGRA